MATPTPTFDNTQIRIQGHTVLWSAPLGTPLPTSATSPLDPAFVNIGLTDVSGLTCTPAAQEKKLFASQNGGALVAITKTQAEESYKFKTLQFNATNVALAYGATVDPTTGGYVTNPGLLSAHRVWVFDSFAGGAVERTCLADGQITQQPPDSWVTGEAREFDLTVAAYLNSTIGGFSQRYSTALAAGGSVTNPAQWTASSTVATGTYVSGGSHVYQATNAGTTSGTAPTWPTSGTVTDGAVTWQFVQ